MEEYLKREELENYLTLIECEDLKGDPFDAYLVSFAFTDAGIDEVKNNMDITSDDVEAYMSILIWYDATYMIDASLFVDGELYDSEIVIGENYLEDFT